VVPPNVPATDFWAITVYDLESASYLRNMPNSSVDSNMDKKKNEDDSTTVYFGPKASKGLESNWIPTNGKRFFLLFRFYGPTKGLRDEKRVKS